MIVLVPALEPDSRLVDLVRDLLATDPSLHVLVVDDGSGPAHAGVFDAAAALGAVVVRHEVNRGLGAALRTGFSVARGEVVVTTDSDATYRYSEIPALLARLTPDVSIVTASPYHPEGGVAGVSPLRLVLSRGSSFMYRTLVDPGIHTYTSLFRAYRAEVLRNVSFEANGFLAVAELLVKALPPLQQVEASERRQPTDAYAAALIYLLQAQEPGQDKAALTERARASLKQALQRGFSYVPQLRRDPLFKDLLGEEGARTTLSERGIK